MSPEHRILRTSVEPCQFVSEQQVHRALTGNPNDYFLHMLERLRSISAGKISVEMPPKQVFADPGDTADFRIMPCITRSGDQTFKTVKLVGTNIAQIVVPDQITVGKALVIDPVENYITHVVDACLLSSARTGMCATLAMQLLATQREHLTIIGSGRVGYYTAFYAAAVCGTRNIVFTDILSERAEAAAQALKYHFPEVHCSASPVSQLPPTNIVVLATTSSRPVCAPPAWNAGLIISMGADIDHQSELDPAWADCADIYVDTLDTARFGDLRAWIGKGHLDLTALTDFQSLLQNGISHPAVRPRLFVSTGSALFDNLTLEYLLRRI